MCNEDQDCKAYSYWTTYKWCYYYTTAASCITENSVVCVLEGNVHWESLTGPIMTVPAPGEDGCYIKEKRNFLDIKLNQGLFPYLYY